MNSYFFICTGSSESKEPAQQSNRDTKDMEEEAGDVAGDVGKSAGGGGGSGVVSGEVAGDDLSCC